MRRRRDRRPIGEAERNVINTHQYGFLEFAGSAHIRRTLAIRAGGISMPARWPGSATPAQRINERNALQESTGALDIMSADPPPPVLAGQPFGRTRRSADRPCSAG